MLPVAILAGGLATRLRPITETIPKALVEINDEPFLAHQLRLLKRGGIGRVVMCLGYRGEQIVEYAGDGAAFGLQVEYSFDSGAGPSGPPPGFRPASTDSVKLNSAPKGGGSQEGPAPLLGTAGAIRKALPLLGEEFFVLYGDSYLPCDYAAVEEHFRTSGKRALMTVFPNEGKWDTSNVEFTDGRIVAYDKTNRTPAMRHIDYGLGAFRREAFDGIPDDRPSDLAALYQGLLRRGELAAFEAKERFYEIGSPEGIRELAEFLAR